jgi:hypothetical protein
VFFKDVEYFKRSQVNADSLKVLNSVMQNVRSIMNQVFFRYRRYYLVVLYIIINADYDYISWFG